MRRSERRGPLAALRSQPRQYLKDVARHVLEAGAAVRMQELPQRQLAGLLRGTRFEVHVTPFDTRHDWSLGAAEQLILQLLVADRGVRTAFEIGTFNGATTALIAEALPDKGSVVTVDLPEARFSATQSPAGFSAADVGAVHRASPAAHKVQQVRADSLTLDPSPWRAWADLVLVDGAHDYEHGFADTRTALAVAKPGALLLWDDFTPYWHGLVHGILDAAEGRPVERLAGTPLGLLVAE